ncbi:hypothetical protein [Mucilaginibacter jinjuensis]|uniref:Uncharacterized protein n=1 Tax=Mucilaginibacter jinjuensis TaxID=1176721 RepID=A0ABY7T6L2_9SPHI|nr:hypothetical protein [Mucilaginibacter jinjuensis]WCT11481.1 hypothetical protein PQO05_22335 [Mucilaginibacter jinjuensis]
MNTHAEQTHQNKTSAAGHEHVQEKKDNAHSNYLTDNRPASIAQRKLQDNIKAVTQLKSKVKINDDKDLEKEADVMGGKALQMQTVSETPLADSRQLKSDTVQRTIGLGPGSPAGFKELTSLFLKVARAAGGEIVEMINAFDTDPKMHLYFYALPLPKGENGLEGRTIPAIKIGDDWKLNPNISNEDWNTLPHTAELRIELHIYYTGEGLDKDHSKHFYTLLHEFAVHAQPFYTVFKKIRLGQGPKSKDAAAELGHHAHFDQQHSEMALGENKFYEEMYSKSLDIIRQLELEGKNKNISTSRIVDQQDLDKYTQKLSLFKNQRAVTDKDMSEAAKLLQDQPSKENYTKFHQSLQRASLAIKPIKDDLDTFTMMYELWPQLVAVFPREKQFIGTREMFLSLLPKVKLLNKAADSYYTEISSALVKTTANLGAAS